MTRYLLQHADRYVMLATLGTLVFILIDATLVGYVVGSKLHGVAQAAQTLCYLFNLFVHK